MSHDTPKSFPAALPCDAFPSRVDALLRENTSLMKEREALYSIQRTTSERCSQLLERVRDQRRVMRETLAMLEAALSSAPGQGATRIEAAMEMLRNEVQRSL